MRGRLLIFLGVIIAGCGRPPGPPAPTTSEILPSTTATLAETASAPLAAPTWSDTDWPGWRGPSEDGISTGPAVPVVWNESENVLWKTRLPGRGHASPVVLEDTIYVATADDADQTQAVIAIDKHRGKRLWKTPLFTGKFEAQARMHDENSHASSTLATDGERLFAVFLNDQRIWCSALDLEGNELWRMEAGGFASRFGYSVSPVVFGRLVIVAADHEQGGFVAGLDRGNGNIVWRRKRDAFASYATPRVVRLGDKDLLVLSGGNTIMAYDPRTGEELWSVKGTAQSTVSTVVTYRDLVIASGGYPDSETIALRADGSVAWRNKEKTYVPSMIVVSDHLYFVQDDGIARCWDAATGKERWKHRIGGKYRASPVFSGGNLFVTDMAGKTVVFKADPRRFELVAENQLGTEGFASPAVSDGRLYLRVADGHGPDRQEALYCIGEREPPVRNTRLPRGSSPPLTLR